MPCEGERSQKCEASGTRCVLTVTSTYVAAALT